MKTIYKYQLKPGTNKVSIPEGAQILQAASVQGEPVLYAIVDTEEKDRGDMTVHVYGTGPQPFHEGMPEPDAIGYKMNYIGTVNCEGLMWHVFVEVPEFKPIELMQAVEN